jgi:hypothetical protein
MVKIKSNYKVEHSGKGGRDRKGSGCLHDPPLQKLVLKVGIVPGEATPAWTDRKRK